MGKQEFCEKTGNLIFLQKLHISSQSEQSGFHGFRETKKGLLSQIHQQALTQAGSTPRIVPQIRGTHLLIVIGRFYKLVFNVRQCFCFTGISSLANTWQAN